VSDVDTGVVDSLKVVDPDGRLEKRPNAPQQKTRLFDHLVGAGKQHWRYVEAECPGGLEVDG
jgi:hypothetical protein